LNVIAGTSHALCAVAGHHVIGQADEHRRSCSSSILPPAAAADAVTGDSSIRLTLSLSRTLL